MHTTHTLALILLTLGYTHNAYCMHFVVHKLSNKPYVLSLKSFNASEERKKAYQKWCTTRIKWNDTNKTSQTSHKSNNKIIENKMAYYEQFRKK